MVLKNEESRLEVKTMCTTRQLRVSYYTLLFMPNLVLSVGSNNCHVEWRGDSNVHMQILFIHPQGCKCVVFVSESTATSTKGGDRAGGDPGYRRQGQDNYLAKTISITVNCKLIHSGGDMLSL